MTGGRAAAVWRVNGGACSRGRIGRGGRLIIDRVPLAPRCEDPNVQAYWDEHGGGPGGEGSRRQGGRHVVLSSGPDVKFLERYPSTDLHHNHDVFKVRHQPGSQQAPRTACKLLLLVLGWLTDCLVVVVVAL